VQQESNAQRQIPFRKDQESAQPDSVSGVDWNLQSLANPLARVFHRNKRNSRILRLLPNRPLAISAITFRFPMSFLRDFLSGSLPSQTHSPGIASEKHAPKQQSSGDRPPTIPPSLRSENPLSAPDSDNRVTRSTSEHHEAIFASPTMTMDDFVQICEEGGLEDVSTALAAGLDINGRNRYSWTPLGAAALKGHLEVVQLLLNHGAQVDERDGSGQTALFNAASRGALDIALLLIQAGADVNGRDRDGRVPLNSALTNRKSENHMRIIELLISKGARTDVRDRSGWTPLHQAARNNSVRGAKLLMQHRADVNAETKDLRTPLQLHLEEERGDEGREMQNLLVAAGGKAPPRHHASVMHLKAQSIHSAGRYEEALPYYDGALGLDAQDPDIWYNKGCALDELERLKEAIDCYDRVIQLQENAADALNRKGVALGKLGDWGEQLVCFKKAVVADSENTNSWSYLGGALSKKGTFREALYCYDKLLALNESDAIAWFNKGVILAKLGRDAEALDCYDRACELDSSLDIPLSDPRDQAIEDFYKRVVRPRRNPPP